MKFYRAWHVKTCGLQKIWYCKNKGLFGKVKQMMLRRVWSGDTSERSLTGRGRRILVLLLSYERMQNNGLLVYVTTIECHQKHTIFF